MPAFDPVSTAYGRFDTSRETTGDNLVVPFPHITGVRADGTIALGSEPKLSTTAAAVAAVLPAATVKRKDR